MTYAGDRQILDADSHVMELADFLDEHIDPDQRDRLRRRAMDAFAPLLETAMAGAATRRADTTAATQAEERLLEEKGWLALGAFDPLGFDGQLVFATFATTMFAGRDVDRLYAGSAAQNRAMVEFCSGDERLYPVAFVPLVEPACAVALATEAIDEGCAAVMVPSTAAGERGPTHPDLDGFWDTLSEA